MIELFRQRDFGSKINATFQYVTQNFRSLGLALLYIVGPVALVAGIAAGVMQSNMLRLVRESANARTNDFMAAFQVIGFLSSPSFWVTTLFGLLANIAVILTTYAHMKVYDRNQGSSVSVAEVWEEVEPIIGRAILISVLTSILVGISFIFFFIPGLYLAIVFSLSLTVMSFEDTDLGATWSRCFQLIRNKWWSTFGLIVIMGVIVAVIGLIFSLPAAIIGFLTSAKLLPNVSVAWLMLGNVINQVGRTLLNVVIYTAIGFQYTNLVERQEGRGLQSTIDSIGTAPAQPRATDDEMY